MQKVLSPLRRAITDYKMIQDGDTVYVGLSGGKDSVLLLTALKSYQIFSPEKFSLRAITVDMGFDKDDPTKFDLMKNLCASLDVPLEIIETDIAEVIFDIRKESNPCALCAKMRRGSLCGRIAELGGGKLALGHNADDAGETLLMSLFYEGRLSCFQPVSYLSKTDITMIRPLIYIEEKDIIGAINRLKLPIQKNKCPIDRHTKREDMKDMIKDIQKQIPSAKVNLLSAIFNPERNNLWEKP